VRSLVITMLDVEQEPNQRIQYVIRLLETIADETVVVTKVRAHSRSLGALLRDALAFRVRCSAAGRVTTLAVHPPLNYAHAIASGLVHAPLEARPSWLRCFAAGALSLLGIARDVALVPAFVLVILARTRGSFEVCVAQGPWEAAVAWPLRALGRVHRLVYDDIDYVPGGQMLSLRRAYVGWLERALIARADVAMSTGWRLAALRERTTGRKVRVIPNGVDPECFRRPRRPHPPTLVYAGNVAHYAGVDLAVAALPRLCLQVPDMRLLIVGGGDPPYLEGLRKLTAQLGVERAVEFRGAVPYASLPELFAESDIGFAAFRPIPLRAFAFSLKVLEYMAAGLPVIGTTDSETADLLDRYGCGRAIRFETEALAAAVVELLRDPSEYARAAEGAAKAAERFTWRQTMESIHSVLAAQSEVRA
jgi:glycosyltransferase involved in cell wall biosynthesis